MQRVIRHHQMSIYPGTQSIQLPQGAKVLGVSTGYGVLVMTTLNDPYAPLDNNSRYFLIAQGGMYFEAPQEVPPGARMQYIGSVDARINPQSPPMESDMRYVFELIPIN